MALEEQGLILTRVINIPLLRTILWDGMGFSSKSESGKITRDDFDKRLKLLKSKNKDKYEFLVKSGQGMKDCLFELFCKVWATEKKPQQWRDTIIIQIWKGKSDAANFDNQRNINTKKKLRVLL